VCSSMRKKARPAEPMTSPTRPDPDARAAALTEVAAILGTAARELLNQSGTCPATFGGSQVSCEHALALGDVNHVGMSNAVLASASNSADRCNCNSGSTPGLPDPL
jgi:hypothetical protein